jgi:hypothetical protein
MTPKDKVNDLIVKILVSFERITLIEAKKIALISVDEILDTIVVIYSNDFELLNKYWHEVRQEIELL